MCGCVWEYYIVLIVRVFLAKQFEYLLPHLENLIPETNRNFLTQFFSQVQLSLLIITDCIYYIDCDSMSRVESTCVHCYSY